MGRLRIRATLLLAAILVSAAGEAAIANVVIHISKPTQTMTVAVDGQVRYRWPVSTGASGYSTPAGSYTPSRLVPMHYSREWDNAGMPHSIFFTSRGHAIHGSDHPGLGTPRSHGCVRLSLSNARTLFQLVQANGMGRTKVLVRGSDPAGSWAATSIPRQGAQSRQTRQQPRRPWSFFPF